VGINEGGEYGADLLWVTREYEEVVLKDTQRIFAFERLDWGLLLLQGHGSVGQISVLTQDKNGRWTVRPIVELTAAPWAFRTLPDGGIAVATEYDGTLLIDRRGTVKGFECHEVRPSSWPKDHPKGSRTGLYFSIPH